MSLTIDLGFHSTEWISMSEEFIRSKFFRDAGWVRLQKKILKNKAGYSWMECPAASEYLACFGYRYDGNDVLEKNGEKTDFLELPLYLMVGWMTASQVAAQKEVFLLAPDDMWRDYFGNGMLTYLEPLLKKGNIHIQTNSYHYLELLYYEDVFVDACRKGIEVIINERSSKEFETPEEFEYYVEELIWNTKYLTRELDARVFHPEEHKVFEPYETTLEEYINTLNENGESKEYLQSRREDAEYRVVVNGKNFFNGNYRRYPIYQLLLIDGEWKFLSYNSIKNSCFIELLEQIMLPTKTIKNETKYEEKAIEGIEKIFTLVLDCDEVCEAEKYWEHICFFVKYTPGTDVIEICDQGKALLEFHELLQKSTDIENSL